jgi:hypothetical protein
MYKSFNLFVKIIKNFFTEYHYFLNIKLHYYHLEAAFLSTVQSWRTIFKMDTMILKACKLLLPGYFSLFHAEHVFCSVCKSTCTLIGAAVYARY